jgi:tetratricopeptide (TPR) repeat protein
MPGPEIDNPLPVQSVVPPRSAGRLSRWAIAMAAIAALGMAGWLIGRHVLAGRHVRSAEEALARYDFAAALDRLEQALRIGPDTVSTRLQAARAARRGEQYDRAEAHLAVCEKKGARMETALERIMLRAQQGDLTENERSLQRLVMAGHADTVLLLEALARGYLATFNMGNALAVLNDLIQREPEHPWAHFWRGSLYETLLRSGDALPDYRRAVELAPEQSAFRLALALALLQSGQTAKAGPHFDGLLRQRPNDPQVLLGAARYERACARPARALEYLDVLLRDHPESAEAWAQRGRAYREEGNHAEAVRCLRKGFELQPRSYAIGFDLYTELYGLGQTGEAKAIEQRVEHQKQQEQQVEKLLIQLEQDKNSVALRYELGMVYLRSEVEEMALRWFQAALQIDPAHRPTHQALAEYYQKKGNVQAAAFHRQRAGKGKS